MLDIEDFKKVIEQSYMIAITQMIKMMKKKEQDVALALLNFVNHYIFAGMLYL